MSVTDGNWIEFIDVWVCQYVRPFKISRNNKPNYQECAVPKRILQTLAAAAGASRPQAHACTATQWQRSAIEDGVALK
jgi:hypothetical protein